MHEKVIPPCHLPPPLSFAGIAKSHLPSPLGGGEGPAPRRVQDKALNLTGVGVMLLGIL
jgi:hypothetical protein